MRGRVLILGVCLVLAACSDPEGPEPLAPIKEKFEWRLDTIRLPGASQFVVNRVVGCGDGTAYLSAMGNSGLRGMLWRYTDTLWQPVELNRKYGGPLEGLVSQITDVDACGDHLVWMVGSRRRDTLIPPKNLVLYFGFLASFDGHQFKEVDLRTEPELTCLDVISASNIWFGCSGPYIYHYDGVNAAKYGLPMDQIGALSGFPIQSIMVHEIACLDEEVHIAAILNFGDEVGRGIVSLRFANGKDWKIVDFATGATITWNAGMSGLWISPEGSLYSGGDNIYRLDNGDWRPIYRPLTETTQVFGSSDREIWGVGRSTNVVRCVEGKWTSNMFFRIPDAHKTTSWLDGWTDGNRVFIVGNPDDGAMNFGVVAHGK